jgi:lauroyl/myristoyl acyltransferase
MTALLSALSERGIDVGYAAAWRTVRTLPEPVAEAVFARAADLAYRRDGRSVKQLRRNLVRVLPADHHAADLEAVVRAGMRSYARYWLETFRLPAMDVAQTVARALTEGTEHLDAAVAAGKGAIIALPHSGNWDVAGLWLVNRGYPFVTVAERLKPESLFDKFVEFRQSLGMQVLALTGGPEAPMTVLKRHLLDGGVVCLVADRDLSRSGIDVDYFGEATRMPAGPSLLAATTGAALLPVHLHFRPTGWAQWIGPPVDLGAGNLRSKLAVGTQSLADSFAARIALHPEDWHMLQPLWLSDLDPRRLKPSDTTGHDATGHYATDHDATGHDATDHESAGG